MKRSDAFPTKYMSKDDVKSPVTGIIARVVNETLGQGDDQEIKPVMYFSSGPEKPMVVNATNWMSVEAIYGDESDNWTGKPIEIWVDPSVSFGGKRIGGLRLRAPSNHVEHIPTTAELRAKYGQRMTEAQGLGLKAEPLAPNATDEQIIAAGLKLKAAIDAARDF